MRLSNVKPHLLVVVFQRLKPPLLVAVFRRRHWFSLANRVLSEALPGFRVLLGQEMLPGLQHVAPARSGIRALTASAGAFPSPQKLRLVH